MYGNGYINIWQINMNYLENVYFKRPFQMGFEGNLSNDNSYFIYRYFFLAIHF